MDERTKELVAIGASAAVNCHPCLKVHLAKCDGLWVDRAEVAEAVEVGLMVNRGAAAKTLAVVPLLLGEAAEGGGAEREGCGCG